MLCPSRTWSELGSAFSWTDWIAPSGPTSTVASHCSQRRQGAHKDIHTSIDEKVLGGKPIAFASTAVEPRDDGVTVRGELTMAHTTRPATFDIDVSGDGRVAGTLPVTQSEWDIKPYKAFMGTLKVRDTVEIVLDVQLSAD